MSSNKLKKTSGDGISPGLSLALTGKVKSIVGKEKDVMEYKTQKQLQKEQRDIDNKKVASKLKVKKFMYSGGAAGQTKSTKTPKQSVFQQLKKAQMLRKHDGRGKK